MRQKPMSTMVLLRWLAVRVPMHLPHRAALVIKVPELLEVGAWPLDLGLAL